MSNLIPTISLSEFKKLSAAKLRDMKSVEVTSDGETLLFVIIPPKNGGMTITDSIKTSAEYLAVRGNTVGGQDPTETEG